MATTFPRYNYIISRYLPQPPLPLPLPLSETPSNPPPNPSRTLDPLFALTIGIAAASIRIRREENEKRAGIATTSIVSSTTGARVQGTIEGEDEYGRVGFKEVARVGWGRLWRRVTGDEGG